MIKICIILQMCITIIHCYKDQKFINNVIIIKTKILLLQAEVKLRFSSLRQR